MANEGLNALLLGASGAIGKEVLTEIIKNPKFKQVVVIGRRSLDNIDNPKVVQKIVDFEKLDESKDAFSNVQVAYCCLGTTRAKAGADGFVRVDRDYVHNVAKISKEFGCQHFHLVTSKGSNENSFSLYLKTKGEIEKILKDLNFDRLSIYRPGLLLCERQEGRPFEKVAQLLARGFDLRNKFSVSVETVAHAMIQNTFLPMKDPVEILEHSDINNIGTD